MPMVSYWNVKKYFVLLHANGMDKIYIALHMKILHTAVYLMPIVLIFATEILDNVYGGE